MGSHHLPIEEARHLNQPGLVMSATCAILEHWVMRDIGRSQVALLFTFAALFRL